MNVHQDLTPDLTLSAVLYNTSRDAESKIFQPFDARESTSTATTDQRGGPLALDWRVGDNWAWTQAHTQSRLDIERRKFFGPSPVGAALENRGTLNQDARSDRRRGGKGGAGTGRY